MKIENEKNLHKIVSLVFSPIAILKLIGVSLLWHTIGFILGMAFNFGIFLVFIVLHWGIFWLFPYWQPAYSIIHRIVGNKNISPVLETLNLKWWQYLISPGLMLFFLIYVFYFAIKLLFK